MAWLQLSKSDKCGVFIYFFSYKFSTRVEYPFDVECHFAVIYVSFLHVSSIPEIWKAF